MAERESGPMGHATASGVIGALPLKSTGQPSARVRGLVALPWPPRSVQRWFAARGIVTQAAILWALSRLLLALATVASLLQRHQSLSHFLSSWVQWDAGWYLDIAHAGYQGMVSAAFFPLYPLTIRAGSILFPFLPLVAVALLVSNAATFVAAIGIGRLAAYEMGGPRLAPLAILVTLAYPLALFLAAPYTEGVFLACAVFALYCARRGQWWRAALCAFLAVLTRSTGVVLLLPLLWEYGAQHKWWHLGAWRNSGWQSRLRPRVLSMGAVVGGAVPLAFAVIMALNWHLYGDPLHFVREEGAYWHHAGWSLWQTLGAIAFNISHPPASPYFRVLMVVNLLPFAAMLLLTVVCVRRLTPPDVLYMLGLLYLIISAPVAGRPEVIISAGRYLVVAFPLFIEVARWGESHPRILAAGICVGVVLQAVFAFLFVRGVWVE